jgi:outer membrane protein OmpA-like peptidoglycan-associated protein
VSVGWRAPGLQGFVATAVVAVLVSGCGGTGENDAMPAPTTSTSDGGSGEIESSVSTSPPATIESSAEVRVREIISDYDGRETSEGTVLSVPAEVLFDFDDDQLRPDARSTMEEVLEVVEFYSDAPVEIVGHTDAEGDPGYNQGLSERRAQAVGDYLGDAGVATGRLSTSGRGEDEPVADNTTEEGRQANRRVEVLLRGAEPPEAE